MITHLKVFTTHQTRISIDSGEGDRAQFFKIEIQYRSVNGVQIWTHP